MEKRRLYYPLTDFLKERYGERVYKVTLDGGFTCPHRDLSGGGGCVYCEPETLVPKAFEGALPVEEQLRRGIEQVGRRHRARRFIAYFQVNTSTFAPAEELERVYRPALEHPDVAGIAVSTRPDCLGDDVVALLSSVKKVKDLWVEIGLQSANPRTLEAINRGHTPVDFERAAGRLSSAGIDVCAHLILGLPGEGEKEVLDTVGFVAGLGVWGVKFHQMQVIRGTRLEKLYESGEVKTLSLDEYAALVAGCLERLPPSVVVHRLSGDVPLRYLVAPRWGANKFVIAEKILSLMAGRGSFQGSALGEAGFRKGPEVTMSN